jgi:transposase InsO family protein
MRFSAHPERKSTFERLLDKMGLIHGKCKPGCPWQNGIVERSHRIDNEELFQVMRFPDPEMRRYQLKLWDCEYNTKRPHQGVGGKTPMQVYMSEYRRHAFIRMLM